ncbi:MAG: TIGR04100 family radical SAM protein [Ruminococcus sp.]|nr:TIGR04100 family radical SAM protein [Ruminococcus sp.]
MRKAMTISYPIGNKLYMNITNKCPCSCTFCIRHNGDNAYGSDPLWLEHEPSFEEIKADLAARDIASYEEIIFCGFGESTSRLDILLQTAELLRNTEGCPPLRLNTNGLSDLISGRSTADEICAVFDFISVSLNAGTEDEYMKVTRPSFPDAFSAMQKFTADCVKNGSAKVIMSVVDVIPPEQIDASREICENLGAQFRVRPYDA